MDLRAKPTNTPQSGLAETAATTQSPLSKWTPRNAVVATLIVLAIAAGFVLAWRFQGVLFSFLVAIMLHIAVKPAVDRLRQRGVRLELGMIVVYLVVFAVVAGFLALLVPFIINQISTIFTRLPAYYTQVRESLLQSSGMLQTIAQSLPADITSMLMAAPSTPSSVTEVTPASSPFDAVNSFLYAVAAFIGIFLMAYYWAVEGERITYSLLLRVPAEKRDDIRELIAEMESKVGAFFRGQIVLCAFVGFFQLAAYVLIGLPVLIGAGAACIHRRSHPINRPDAWRHSRHHRCACHCSRQSHLGGNLHTGHSADREQHSGAARDGPSSRCESNCATWSIIAFGVLFGLVGRCSPFPLRPSCRFCSIEPCLPHSRRAPKPPLPQAQTSPPTCRTPPLAAITPACCGSKRERLQKMCANSCAAMLRLSRRKK